MPTDPQKLSLARTLGAREIIRPHLSPTPLRQYPSLNRHIGAQVYVKHENHNPTGAFKVRGGIFLMSRLTDAELVLVGPVRNTHDEAVAEYARRSRRFGR